jgi:hypothetical protein
MACFWPPPVPAARRRTLSDARRGAVRLEAPAGGRPQLASGQVRTSGVDIEISTTSCAASRLRCRTRGARRQPRRPGMQSVVMA